VTALVRPERLEGVGVAVFHAHPDDEVFATAAATCALAGAGARVCLVVATGGERAEQGPDSGLGDAEARALREARLDRSCELLGIADWRYLAESGHWIDTADSSRSLAGAQVATVAAAVRSALDALEPQMVLTVGPDGLTGHPDHIAMHRAVAEALQLPGWRPRSALGAAVLDADVRAAGAVIDQCGYDSGYAGGFEYVAGVPAAQIAQTIYGSDAELARKQAMDVYLDGLGSDPVEQLVRRYNLRGASLVLRVLFDRVGWDTDRFVQLPLPEPRGFDTTDSGASPCT